MNQNSRVENILTSVSEGDLVKIKYEIGNRFSEKTNSVEVVTVEVPSNPKTSVTSTYSSDADLEKDAREILEDGADHINIQSARKNSYASKEGYRYEIRCLTNKEIDAGAIVNLNIIGNRNI